MVTARPFRRIKTKSKVHNGKIYTITGIDSEASSALLHLAFGKYDTQHDRTKDERIIRHRERGIKEIIKFLIAEGIVSEHERYEVYIREKMSKDKSIPSPRVVFFRKEEYARVYGKYLCDVYRISQSNINISTKN